MIGNGWRLRALLAVAVSVAAVSMAPAAFASTATKDAAQLHKKKTTPIPTEQVKALAAELGLPVGVVKRGVRGLEKSDADQTQSGPTALPPDPALGILHFGEFPGASGERIFLVRLDAAPEGDDVSYEYGLGVAIDGQPQSTPNPTALAGFGRVALSRLWVIEVGGEFLGLDPAASYSRVETVATGVVFKNLVVFRVPDAELGEGKFYLQSFGRQGDTAESPAGFSIVDGDLAS